MSDLQIRATGTTEVIQSSDGRITLSVPIQIKRRSGRKQMTLPNGQSGQPGKLLRPWDVAATPLQLALARGHRWLAMLESGKVKNLTEIAALEGIDNSYVSRMVNLTTLAPDIVEAILEDALPDHLTLFDLAVDPPALWEEQRLILVSIRDKGGLQNASLPTGLPKLNSPCALPAVMPASRLAKL